MRTGKEQEEMNIEKMVRGWLWFKLLWKVDLPTPILLVKWLWGKGGTCNVTTVTLAPWASRRTMLHEYGHWLGLHGGEASAEGKEFEVLVGGSYHDYDAGGRSRVRELWANSIVGLLMGKWRGGRKDAEPILRRLLRSGNE